MSWWLDSDEDAEVIREIEDPALSDRAVALMAASFLDDRLAKHIRAELRDDDPHMVSSYTKGDGPLASFSSRMKFGFLRGYYTRETYNDLDRIRKIRNEFAHTARNISFSTDSIRAHATNITIVDRMSDGKGRLWGGKTVLECFIVGDEPRLVPTSPRARYVIAVELIMGVISAYSRERPRPPEI